MSSLIARVGSAGTLCVVMARNVVPLEPLAVDDADEEVLLRPRAVLEVAALLPAAVALLLPPGAVIT